MSAEEDQIEVIPAEGEEQPDQVEEGGEEEEEGEQPEAEEDQDDEEVPENQEDEVEDVEAGIVEEENKENEDDGMEYCYIDHLDETCDLEDAPEDEVPEAADYEAPPEAPPKKRTRHIDLSKIISGLWSTRGMMKDPNPDKQIIMKTTIRELILYCMFLFVIVFMTFSQYSTNFYLMRKQFLELFPTMMKITQPRQFWEWTEDELPAALYWEELYNQGRKKTNYRCPTGEIANAPCEVPTPDRNVLYENRMLGVPRIRQIRVKDGSCAILPSFSNAIRKCYANYREDFEDTTGYDDFDPDKKIFRQYTSKTAWIHQTAEELSGSKYTGEVTTYSGGGFVQDLNYESNLTSLILSELKTNKWIDQGTRFVSVDFTTYNVNLNLFAIIKLTFEFPATGGIMPRMDIRIVKLLKYIDVFDYIIMTFEGLFMVFTFYYLIEEILEVRVHGIAHMSNLGNILDSVVIGTSITQVLLIFYTEHKVTQTLEVLVQKPFEFADFSLLGDISKYATYLSGFNLFVAWIKIFKYLSFNRTMILLSGTLSGCAKELSGFTVMFAIIFFAFSLLGYLLFNSQIAEYRTVVMSCYTMFRTILGDFNFEAILLARSVIGPIYFITYIFFVFFVLLNVFLAIIGDTYSEVKAEIVASKPTFQLKDFFKVGVNNCKMAAGIRDRKLDVENALKKAAEDDGYVTYQELREILKYSNFSDTEIDLYFMMFQDDPALADILVDEDEEDKAEGGMDRPKSGKEARHLRSARLHSAYKANEELDANRFYAMQERVGRMEMTIGPISRKLDVLIDRLDEMKKQKRRKK